MCKPVLSYLHAQQCKYGEQPAKSVLSVLHAIKELNFFYIYNIVYALFIFFHIPALWNSKNSVSVLIFDSQIQQLVKHYFSYVNM